MTSTASAQAIAPSYGFGPVSSHTHSPSLTGRWIGEAHRSPLGASRGLSIFGPRTSRPFFWSFFSSRSSSFSSSRSSIVDMEAAGACAGESTCASSTARRARWRCSAARNDRGVRLENVTNALPNRNGLGWSAPAPIARRAATGSAHARATKFATSAANSSSAAAFRRTPRQSLAVSIARLARLSAVANKNRTLPQKSAPASPNRVPGDDSSRLDHPPRLTSRVGPPTHTTSLGPGRVEKCFRHFSLAVANASESSLCKTARVTHTFSSLSSLTSPHPTPSPPMPRANSPGDSYSGAMTMSNTRTSHFGSLTCTVNTA